MKRRLTIILALSAMASALASPGAASAAATIGSLLTKAPEESACGKATFTNVALGAPAMLTAPYDGVVVRWRAKILKAGGAYEYHLRILEPTGGGEYKFVSASPPQKLPLAGLNVVGLLKPLPIKAGDIIAYDCPTGAPAPANDFGLPGAVDAYFTPIPANGVSVAPNNQLGGEEELIDADVVGNPTVTSVSPATGPIGGGTTVTLTGTHLADITGVTFGGEPAASLMLISETEARATTAMGFPRKVDVHAINAAGTSAAEAGDAFTYVGPPQITKLTQSHHSWRPGEKLASISKAAAEHSPRGTVFSFNLNEAAEVSLSFSRSVPGRRIKGKCGAQTKGNSSKPSCKRALPKGTLTLSAHAGVNKVVFQGRISATQKLKPGGYLVSAAATNGFGETSSPYTPKTLGFKIVK